MEFDDETGCPVSTAAAGPVPCQQRGRGRESGFGQRTFCREPAGEREAAAGLAAGEPGRHSADDGAGYGACGQNCTGRNEVGLA